MLNKHRRLHPASSLFMTLLGLCLVGSGCAGKNIWSERSPQESENPAAQIASINDTSAENAKDDSTLNEAIVRTPELDCEPHRCGFGQVVASSVGPIPLVHYSLAGDALKRLSPGGFATSFDVILTPEASAAGKALTISEPSGSKRKYVQKTSNVWQRQDPLKVGTMVKEAGSDVFKESINDAVYSYSPSKNLGTYLMSEIKTAAGVIALERDMHDLVIRIGFPGEANLVITRDSDGRIQRVTDGASELLNVSYDRNGGLHELRSGGQSEKFTYIGSAIASVENAAGLTQYVMNGDKVTTVQGPTGSMKMTYESVDIRDVITLIDVTGNTKRSEFTNGLLTRVVIGKDLFDFVRDPKGFLLQYVSPTNEQTKFEYFASGAVRTRTDITPGGAKAVTTYDRNGNITEYRDENGVVWRYTYDESGAMLSWQRVENRRTLTLDSGLGLADGATAGADGVTLGIGIEPKVTGGSASSFADVCYTPEPMDASGEK